MFETPTFDSEYNEFPRDSRGRLQGDERLHVAFYKRAVENTELSKIEGRKIFEDHDFIRIAIPGDQFNMIDTFATEQHKFRFPNEFKRHQEKAANVISGTPLEHFPGITPSQVAEFKSQNIHTIEDVAELSDAVRIMGVHELKRKAKAFLEVKREESVTR